MDLASHLKKSPNKHIMKKHKKGGHNRVKPGERKRESLYWLEDCWQDYNPASIRLVEVSLKPEWIHC